MKGLGKPGYPDCKESGSFSYQCADSYEPATVEFWSYASPYWSDLALPHGPMGWQGQIYLKPYARTTFAGECLWEYCQYLYNGQPCFRTVGNDATFYRPPTPNQLRRYLNQIPEDFEMCFKVWEELTIPSYAKHARYGAKAGQPNPHFLDAKLFLDLVLRPHREAQFEPYTGPFLFEFQLHGMSSEEFCSRLDTCQLPKDFNYAVEIRNAGLVGPEYRHVLERHGVAHVYNHWSYMPALSDQHQRMERFTATLLFCGF